MAVSLDSSIPLAAVYDGPNWVKRQRTAQEFEQRQKANALELRLAELKAARDADVLERRQRAGKSAYEQLQGIRQGQPAVMEPEPMLQGPVLNQPAFGAMREKVPAIPGREPSSEDYQRSVADALFREGDYEGAFEALKQMRSGQASAMKAFGAETRTGEDGMEYAFNQATGRFEPTGFKSAREPVKPRVQTVRTARGIEVIDLNSLPPGTVLPPEQKPEPAKKPDITPYQKIQLEGSLRDDFRADSKTYDEIRRQHGLITTALKDKSAAGTLAAATSFMKMLDPGSVVRESELGMALAATGITDRIMNYANIIQSGKVLTEQQRNEFASLTNEFLKAAQAEHERRKNTYRQNAAEYGLSPERVVGRDYVQQPSQRSVKSAVQWLKSRKIQNQQQFNAEIRALRKQGWTEAEIRQATQEAGL